MKYIIEGGKKLTGEIKISGNKNSLFPCVAAALLTQEEVVLENVSQISDCEVLVEILKEIGVLVKREDSSLTIHAQEITTSVLPDELVKKLRGSVVLAGAVLSRKKRVSFHHPGGDIIGKRSIETHLEGFKLLGATVKRDDLKFMVEYSTDQTRDCEIFLNEASVTAVENLILTSVLSKRRVILKNCPKEPHVQDLCKMLLLMGAKISGIGTDTIIVEGVERLGGVRFRLGLDYIEAGTYMIAAAISEGRIKLTGIDATDLDPITSVLKRFGVQIEYSEGSLIASALNLRSTEKVTTNLWPGFPTDLMSVVIVLATQSKGVTLCHDWMYESRMFFVDKIISMGAHISLADPHRVFVYGPSKLKGRVLDTPDIRAGMALVLAALIAKGKSVINQAELIERGYEDVIGKLRSLGARIEKA